MKLVSNNKRQEKFSEKMADSKRYVFVLHYVCKFKIKFPKVYT